MLNIKINFTVDLKKVGAAVLTWFLVGTYSVSPAFGLEAPKVETSKTVSVALKEKPVTVHLTYLTVKTTRTEATQSLASKEKRYFDAEALAFLTVYSQGHSLKEWGCLRNLWQKESHFNPKAKNKHSGAYGIAQFMPSTWGNYKVEKTSEASLQIKYGLRYIQKRYSTATDKTGVCNAWKFWEKNNWY